MRPVRIAIASFADMPPEFRDDELLARALHERGAEAAIEAWDDPAVAWDRFDLVVIRSTWDYARRRDDFLDWVDRIGDRLHNAPPLVRWNSDKRYLGDLAEAGVRVVDTRYVGPGDPPPGLEGEVVVKPNVSAGGRDTGRFGPGTYGLAVELIEAIHASGRTAMVQPYLGSVDRLGETAVVCIDGEPAHALRKGPVLRPDEIAPVRGDGAAEVMYDPELVVAAEATAAELENARAIVGRIGEHFDYLPLYARVDTIASGGGDPVLLELEVIEPTFYLNQVPATTAVVADAIIARGV
jgi:glutathione synthase/RimK-type ligase-like ATP-grasp enzyme